MNAPTFAEALAEFNATRTPVSEEDVLRGELLASVELNEERAS